MIPKTTKAEAPKGQEQQRIWDKQARTLARYHASVAYAAQYYAMFQTSKNPLDLEIANDWVDAANRAAKAASEFGVTLVAVPEYQK